MTVDPNLFASLAKNYVGGIAVPHPGQEGYRAQVDSSGLNLEYKQALRVVALGHSYLATPSGSPIDLTQNDWSALDGTYALGTLCDSRFTLAASGGGLIWGGSESIVAVCCSTVTIDPASANNTYAFRYAVDGTPTGDHTHTTPSVVGDTSAPLVQPVAVAPGETLSIVVTNHTDNDDVSIEHVTLMVLALAAAT